MKINGVIISHYHQDHYDNLPIAKEKIPIFDYIDNNYHQDKLNLASFEFKVFNNNQNHYKDENDNSLFLSFKINGYNILLTGDMTKVIETKVINQIRKVDFLQVAHHGSKTSSSIEFLDKIRPNYCLISGKNDHHFNFPNPQTLINLKKISCDVYQTNKLKNISVNFFKNSFNVSSL